VAHYEQPAAATTKYLCYLITAFQLPILYSTTYGVEERGGALVESLHYKPAGHGLNSWWCHWNLSLTWSFRLHYCPGVNLASNTNKYQEFFLEGKGNRNVRLTTLPPPGAERLEIWEPQPPGTLRACPGLYWDCFTFTNGVKMIMQEGNK
jgi:hypothetical protein